MDSLRKFAMDIYILVFLGAVTVFIAFYTLYIYAATGNQTVEYIGFVVAVSWFLAVIIFLIRAWFKGV